MGRLRRSIEDWVGVGAQLVGLGLLIQQLGSLCLTNSSDPAVVMAGAALVGVPEWLGRLLRAQRSLERSVELEEHELNEQRSHSSPGEES